MITFSNDGREINCDVTSATVTSSVIFVTAVFLILPVVCVYRLTAALLDSIEDHAREQKDEFLYI